jgi:uncharacterized protein
MANRLAAETSPYLLQHKDNPVDWYPWGEEALSRARAEDRPILLSVGYSACHWCHVMEHESFADPEVAAVMNDRFVNIKVDREERPDVDTLYMQAVQQMTGHGGWPMTVFLKPDGSPFYGGTYFPPEPRHGLPSFRQVMIAVSDAYRDRREEVERSADELRKALAQGMNVNPEPEGFDFGTIQRAFHGIAARFDHRHGGFGGAPKFPQPMTLDFLLRYSVLLGSVDALRMVERTLQAMAAGGIYDQLGGGFHRYTVDERWLVPHFEKMLYDNALLAQIYARAFQATGRSDFRRVVDETLGYVLREMRSPAGAFFSSQDADSQGEEGKFYVWSAAGVDAILGPDEGPLFRRFYDVTEEGNWEGKNILHAPRTAGEIAEAAGISEARLAGALARGRELLYRARSERVWPGRDEKALTSWNAMMLHAFAQAGFILDDPGYVQVAVSTAEFLLREMVRGDRLFRTWRDGEAKIDAFLEDHALLVDALVELYLATHDHRWIVEARPIADRMIDRFWEEDEEIFYDTGAGGEALILRPRDIYDNATPSGNSAAALGLTRLARLTGEPSYERIAGRVTRGMAGVASRVGQAFGHLLGAVAHQLAPPTEVAIVGEPAAGDTRELVDVLRRRFLPHVTVAVGDPSAVAGLGEVVPLLAHRERIDGRATAFVCQHYACRMPVTEPAELRRELERALATGS